MGRGKRNQGLSKGLAGLHLSSDPSAAQLLPPQMRLAASPRQRRMYEVRQLIQRLDPYFTSTRRQAESCGQREDTFLPWRNGTKCPAQDEVVERIRRLGDFLPQLAEITGSEREAGLWFITHHYDLPLGESGNMRFGYRKPLVAFKMGCEYEILRAAADDFGNEAELHRAAFLSLGHKLLEQGQIQLWDDYHRQLEQPTRDYAPYFHHRPKAGLTLREKIYGK